MSKSYKNAEYESGNTVGPKKKKVFFIRREASHVTYCDPNWII